MSKLCNDPIVSTATPQEKVEGTYPTAAPTKVPKTRTTNPNVVSPMNCVLVRADMMRTVAGRQ